MKRTEGAKAPVNVCGWLLIIVLGAIAIPFSAWKVLAQKPSPPDEVLRISTDLTVLDVQVGKEQDNSIIGNLRAADFQLAEDGVKQEITHFSLDKLPLSIILVLDVSGSVLPFLNQIGAGALQALQRLKPEDEVAIMTIGNRAGGYIHLLQRFSRDREQTAQRLREIGSATDVGGATNIPFALNEATKSIQEATYARSRCFIVIITDMNHLPKKREHWFPLNV